MRELAYIWILLILILCGCKENRIEIPLNAEFIEKESMYIFQIDNDSLTFTPLIKSIDKNKFKYKFHDDTLKVYDFKGWDETSLFVKFMNKDSIKLIDTRSDSIPVFKREYVLYNRNQLYDSTLFLKSITFKKSIVEGGYPEEAFTINDDLDFYVRKDLGVVETSSGTYSHKMTDYKGKVAESTFKYVQDMVRLLDFEFIDKKFGNFSTAHVYWNVEIEFKNGEKYKKGGIDITDNLGQIWAYNFYRIPKLIELTELKVIDGIGWMKNE
ncbi:hypothetical protein [Marinifilum caeruleilacunae]|uniref:DUF3108 domain-containing protein n=1 Tax=Marinifilum caeruleilacunae TaxID=2499076 RepID=A0ABX1WUA6_9BACT|nr:hypothetical protein [Marinifilum caeruleilacunae]NOU59601.1 hypothetical protein [Marinifilum caeruleilacunae]